MALAAQAQAGLRDQFDRIDSIAEENTRKVLAAFQKHRVAEAYFAGTTGYGYDDLGRDKLDEIFAELFGTEDALVRVQFVNGTHAISCALFGALKPGDILVSAVGAPYDTMLGVIGVVDKGPGSLKSYGIEYRQVDLLDDAPDPEGLARAVRDDKTVQLTAQAVQCGSDGQYKLGAWIRDSMAGIGTLTFCEPATGRFGALGHGINDVDTAQLMPLQSGSIMYSEVTDVKKGEKGAPGELHGAFQVNRDLGELYANTASGVFGRLEDGTLTDGLEPVPVAERKEVKTGAATILSNIAGDQVEEYQVEIIRVYPANGADTRNLMLKVTDPRLLETTGGIVQGMSGSPILQNGKLVGAVTHVLVNDPTQGYGILAENMLLEAENGENQS